MMAGAGFTSSLHEKKLEYIHGFDTIQKEITFNTAPHTILTHIITGQIDPWNFNSYQPSSKVTQGSREKDAFLSKLSNGERFVSRERWSMESVMGIL